MTFEQFQASRRYSEDIGTAISDARWEGEPPAKGYLYLDGLYIEEVQWESGISSSTATIGSPMI